MIIKNNKDILSHIIFIFFAILTFRVFYFLPESGIIPNFFHSTPWRKEILNSVHYTTLCCVIIFLARKIIQLNWQEIGFQFTASNRNWCYWLGYGAIVNLGIHILIIAYYYFSHLYLLQYRAPVVLPYFVLPMSGFFNGYIYSPIFEEILFRGITFTSINRIFGNTAAIIVSSFLFWGAHFVYGNQHILQFLFGLALAYCFFKTRSLFWPIILHSMANFFSDSYSIIEWIFPGSMNRFFLW